MYEVILQTICTPQMVLSTSLSTLSAFDIPFDFCQQRDILEVESDSHLLFILKLDDYR